MGFSRFQLPIRLLVCLLLLAACWNAPLFAQSANISGQVLDASGAGVKGGAITLLSVDKQTTLNTVTDGRGAFIFPPSLRATIGFLSMRLVMSRGASHRLRSKSGRPSKSMRCLRSVPSTNRWS